MSSKTLFWKKVKSLVIIASGGSVSFLGIGLYTGNERFYQELLMPAVHKVFPAEAAHNLALRAAKLSLIPKCRHQDGPVLKSSWFGLDFPNPVGIAAGLDKDADAPSGLFKTGIGFLEIGTVTPLPQEGNPKPRIFRLSEDEAIINRCGFNSKGHKHVKKRLEVREKKGILGINLGKNKSSESDEDDYVQGIKEFSLVADYYTINVSSPNTPGLRSLQKKQALAKLLDKVLEARDENYIKLPILLKISPDLTIEDMKDIAEVIMRKGKSIDGLIVSNTTIDRPDSLKSYLSQEAGGLSGKPLKDASTQAIREMYKLTKGKIPIIGVGGIFSGADAYEKIKAGACLVQVYTSLTYGGPPIIGKIKRELEELLLADNYTNVKDAVGVDHRK